MRGPDRRRPGGCERRASAPGGEIIYLNARLNPAYAQQQISSWHTLQVWSQFVEYLFYYDATGTLLPHLATGYTAQDDFTRFTIDVRPGVTFSNGERLDAEAVALNLNVQGLGHPLDPAGLLEGVHRPETTPQGASAGTRGETCRTDGVRLHQGGRVGATSTCAAPGPRSVGDALSGGARAPPHRVLTVPTHGVPP